MAEALLAERVPIPERLLRDLSKDPSRAVLDFAGNDQSSSVMKLRNVLKPVLETAEVTDLSAAHRAAASNLLCAIIEKCQASEQAELRSAVLDDNIWTRVFEIYLQRSDGTKAKSMRQLLLTLSAVLIRNQGAASQRLRGQSLRIFVDIICHRRDRLQVKPALQGLAYFLQKELATVADLVAIYGNRIPSEEKASQSTGRLIQRVFRSFLSWIVHHDTALSAGHLVKSFLGSLRQNPPNDMLLSAEESVSPLWIEPVIETLHTWQDRIQLFKTHVFPHCFLHDVNEYLRFLSYLQFARHIGSTGPLPDQLHIYQERNNGLEQVEEFEILLVALQSGKELGIVKDVEYKQQKCAVKVDRNVVNLRDSIFGDWLADPAPEVRLAGLFLSVFSTAVTRPLTSGVLRSLKRNLAHLHTNTDANFRKELLNHVQRLFDRIKGSTAAIHKSESGKSSIDQPRIPIADAIKRKRAAQLNDSVRDMSAEMLEFVIWYTQFLASELRPTASYQQRITALRALTIVLKCGLDPGVPESHLSKSAQGQLRWAHSLHISSPQLMRSLLDLVLDPFDEIRAASASLLELCLDSVGGNEKECALLMIPDLIKRAESMMLRTGRADHADGVARAYCLLFSQCNKQLPDTLRTSTGGIWSRVEILVHLISQLEETIAIAHKDLSVAVNGRPVHGMFAALRYILDSEGFYDNVGRLQAIELNTWKSIHSRVLACFQELWSCIQTVLCADAPEGHVPEELEDEASLDTKEILSYSWRGLKEASILLRILISKAPIGTGEASLVSPSDVEKLGSLCFLQLVELRHRGAFSTVAQTFAAFCRRCMLVADERLGELPTKWYQETLMCIQAKAGSITRRSAGIPSLMTAIIAADEKPGGSPLFHRAMKDLFEEVSQDAQSSNIQESRLPQVHALNCIKEIFMTSKLSEASEAYIGDALDLAAKTLNSSIWPIRNCGLMLLKALLERLLGSDEAQDWKEQNRTKSSRFSYHKYPHLLGILTNLLDPTGPLRKSMASPTGNSPMDLHGAEGVFPALQILRQALPYDPHRNTFAKLVQNLLSSPHWHLRDMAARTFVSLHLPEEYCDAIKLLVEDLDGAHNRQHGVLLSLKYMLRQYLLTSAESESELSEILAAIQTKATAICRDSCPFTKAAFVDLFSVCDLALLRGRTGTSQDISTCSKTLPVVTRIDTRERVTGDSLLQRSVSMSMLIANVVPMTLTAASAPTEKVVKPIGEELSRFAHEDPDNCCVLLDCLSQVIRRNPTSAHARTTDLHTHLLSYVHELIMTVDDHEVVSGCQAVLAEALAANELRVSFFALMDEAKIFRTIETLRDNCINGPPSEMQSALHLLGYFLDFAFQAYPHRQADLIRQAVYYIRILRMTIVDTNPFDTRFAAVKSLSTLEIIWRIKDESSRGMHKVILGFALVLYDMLNDDDDEVRDEAAAVTSALLRSQRESSIAKNAVPMIAVQRLGRFFATSYSDSTDLCKEALRRLGGHTTNQGRIFGSFRAQLAEARRENTDLFVHEKQNLYKDESLDALFWADVLKSLSTRATRQHYVMDFKKWVLDGIAALSETASAERDGPLGWTTKPEVFVLGLRLLCAADALLAWNWEGSTEVKLALRNLGDICVQTEVNGVWLRRIERILEDVVSRALQRVYLSLSVV